MRGYVLGALFFAVGIAIFVFQNNSQVAIKFITWTSPEISIALVVLAAACAGALVTFCLDSIRYFKVVRKTREVLADNKKLNKQLQQLQGKKSGVSPGAPGDNECKNKNDKTI